MQLYIIKSCDQTLYWNSIKHHVQSFVRGIGGGGLQFCTPTNSGKLFSMRSAYFAKFWPNYAGLSLKGGDRGFPPPPGY